MQTDMVTNNDPNFPTLPVKTKRRQNAPDVIVCLADDEVPLHLIQHAQAVAMSLGGKVNLVRVMEPPEGHRIPFDPIEWEINRQEVRAALERLAKKLGNQDQVIETNVLEGNSVDEIYGCVSKRPQDIIAIFRQAGVRGKGFGSLGGFIESKVGSIFMIPEDLPLQKAEHYTKVLVPLDGSSRAETAVPKAIRIAKANKAELVLCHVTPHAGLTQIAPVDTEALKISRQVEQHNKRVANEYLRRIESQVGVCGIPTSSCVVAGEDVRRALTREIEHQGVGLVVLSSHGQSGHTDAAVGDIASFILGRCPVPEVMIRQAGTYGSRQIFSGTLSTGVRSPAIGAQ